MLNGNRSSHLLQTPCALCGYSRFLGVGLRAAWSGRNTPRQHGSRLQASSILASEKLAQFAPLDSACAEWKQAPPSEVRNCRALWQASENWLLYEPDGNILRAAPAQVLKSPRRAQKLAYSKGVSEAYDELKSRGALKKWGSCAEGLNRRNVFLGELRYIKRRWQCTD